jgi:cyclopropane fatty-acyl-phospholipid synthase-like methyltransferase
VEQFKGETQTFLEPEQSRILSEVLTHIQLEPGKSSFNFNF